MSSSGPVVEDNYLHFGRVSGDSLILQAPQGLIGPQRFCFVEVT